MPSPLAVSSNSTGGNQSVKRKIVFEANNRKANVKLSMMMMIMMITMITMMMMMMFIK
jgi:hypothetical protein